MSKSLTQVKEILPAIVRRTEEALAPYPEGKYNRLLPTTTLLEHVSNYQEPRIEVLEFSPNPDDGDVYIDNRIGKGKRLFHKTALDKIAYAGGVSWWQPGCIVEARIPGKYIRCRATAVIKKANGEPLPISRSHDIDLEVEEEKIREGYARKVRENTVKAGDVEGFVRRDLLQIRGNMLTLCESKACNRVIRAAYGLKPAYSPEEIARPFVLVRFDTHFDLNDPAIQRMLAGRMQEAVGNMFGLQAPPENRQALAEPAEISPVEQAAAEDDLEKALDGQPEEESPALTPEQEKVLRREARIQELMDGCSLVQLKELFIDKFGKRGYSKEQDPRGYIGRFVVGNSKPEEAKKKIRAELVADLEAEANGGGEQR